MRDELISLGTADLAKHKGFPQENYYLTKEQIDFAGSRVCSQNLLQRWIREVHGIHITITPNFCKITCDLENYTIICNGIYGREEFKYEYKTYEQALESGLQEALKLIP